MPIPNAPDSRRWGRLPGASRARVLRGASAALGGGPGTPKDGDTGDTDGSLQRALLRWAAHAERAGGAVQVGVVKGAGPGIGRDVSARGEAERVVSGRGL